MWRGFNCFNFSASKKINYEDSKEAKLLTAMDFRVGHFFSVQLTVHGLSVMFGHQEAECFKEPGEHSSLHCSIS